MDYWIVIVVPILVLLSPKIIKHLIALFLSLRKRGEKQNLQAQIKEYRNELSSISQTDEFARYSRLQRKIRVATDQLSSLARQDLEANIKYVLIGQALAWLLAVIFSFRFTYQLYSLALDYLGYGHKLQEERVVN